MARLAEAGYFNLILTLNVDDAIDDVVRPLPAAQSVLLIYDGSNAAQIVARLSHATPRIKVVKLRGDINAQALPLTASGQFEFPDDLERSVSEWLKGSTILVGDIPYDIDVQRCITQSAGALWCILPDEPASDSFIMRAKQSRPSGEIVTGADAEFNAFFTMLAERVLGEKVKGDQGERYEQSIISPVERLPSDEQLLDDSDYREIAEEISEERKKPDERLPNDEQLLDDSDYREIAEEISKAMKEPGEQPGLLTDSDYKVIVEEMEEEFGSTAITIPGLEDKYSAPLRITEEVPEEIEADERVKKPVVLHLSDLQFGLHHVFEDDQKALDKLKEDINRYEQEGIPLPNIAVVSGDLADTGGAKGDEYGAVTRFLEGLCQHLSIDRRYVVLVPGNHDVNWDEARKLEALQKREDGGGLTATIEKFFSLWQKSEPVGTYVGVNYLQRFGEYAEFYNRFYRRGSGTTHYTCDLSCEKGFNIIYDFHTEWSIAFLAMNSCEKEDHHDKNHYGHISPSVLKSALEEMEATVATPCVKVAVFHHNALAEEREDRLRNFRSEILPPLSQAGFSLVLHGHTHKPNVGNADSKFTGDAQVWVVGAGSVSVARAQRPGSDREGQVPNQYWVLAFELGDGRRQFTAYARQYDPSLSGRYTQGKWIPYNIFTVAGKSSDRKTFKISTI